MKKSYEMDMCSGPVLGKILIYSFPLMLSGILQLLFNAADVIVVGRYAGSQSLAAVGSTGALINLLINVFIGLSVGVNVLVAQYYGAKREQDVNETVHTAVAISLLSGVFLVALGLLVTRPLLELMGTPDDVIDKSAIYMKIYFAGMPATMLYNFGSAVLRAVGDTRRPLYFLTAAGRGERGPEPVFCYFPEYGRGRRCPGHGDLPGDFCGSGVLVPGKERGRFKAQAPGSADQ